MRAHPLFSFTTPPPTGCLGGAVAASATPDTNRTGSISAPRALQRLRLQTIRAHRKFKQERCLVSVRTAVPSS